MPRYIFSDHGEVTIEAERFMLSKFLCFSDVIWPKQQYNGDLYQYYGEIKAHLDAGAKVTVSNLQYILHNYKPYTSSFKCPV